MPLKADASTWMWVIGGIMIAIVMMAVAATIAANIANSNEENRMVVQVKLLADRINGVCDSAVNAKDELEFTYTDMTKAVYPASEENELPPENVNIFISDGRRAEGRQVCLQFRDKKSVRCRKLMCDTTLPYLGSQPASSGIADILAGITGEAKTYRHFLEIGKVGNSIVVTTATDEGAKKRCDIQGLAGIKVAATCDDSEALVFAKDGKAAFVTDALPWITGESNFMQLLENIAGYFGGGKILVVWDNGFVKKDRGSANPADIPAAKDLLKRLGADNERHSQEITKDKLDKYGQLWLVRPGFCSDFRKGSSAAGCEGTIEWGSKEISAISDFAKKGGRLLIITDAGPRLEEYEYMSPMVVNTILSGLKIPLVQLEEPSCYSGKDRFKAGNHEAVKGVQPFTMKYSAKFDCR